MKITNEKTIMIFLMAIMISLTIVQAVTYTTIDDLSNDGELRKLNSGLIVFPSDDLQLSYIDLTGATKHINSYGVGYEIFSEGVKPYNSDEDLWYARSGDIIKIDYSAGSQSLTPHNFNATAYPNLQLWAFLPNPDTYIFTYTPTPSSKAWLVSNDLSSDNTSNYTLPIFAGCNNALSDEFCYPPFVNYLYDNGDYAVDEFLIDGIGGIESFSWTRYSWDGENLTASNQISRTTGDFIDSNLYDSKIFVSEDEQNSSVTVKGNYDSYFYCYDMDKSVSSCLENQTLFYRDGDFIYAQTYYVAGLPLANITEHPQELFFNLSNGNILVYFDELQNTDTITSFDPTGVGQAAWKIGFMGSSFVMPINSQNFVYVDNLLESSNDFQPSLIDILYSSGNIDLQFGSDFRSYVLRDVGVNVYLEVIDTTDNSDLSVIDSDQVFSGIGGASLSSDGRLGSGFPSIDYFNLLVASTNQLEQYYDDNNYPNLTSVHNETVSDFVKFVATGNLFSNGVGFQGIGLEDGGTDVTMQFWADNYNYPSDTYYAIKTGAVAPLDIGSSCNGGSGTYYFPVHMISNLGSGIGWCNYGISTELIDCDSVNKASTSTYPYAKSRQAIDGSATNFIAYLNSSSFAQYTMNGCLGAATATQGTVCSLTGDVGNVRSVYYFNDTYALAGTTLGYLAVCNLDIVDSNNNTQVYSLGAITSNNESIFDIESSRTTLCFDDDCDENEAYIQILTDNYIGSVQMSFGSTSPAPEVCGNAFCGVGENAFNCPSDCSASCGDGYCTHAETSFSCPADCGGAVCGNDVCEGGENESNCPNDCSPVWIPLPIPKEDPYEPPETSVDLRSMKLFGNYILLAGIFDGSDLVEKLDASDLSSLSVLTTGALIDFPYSVDRSGDTVFVGTDDEIHVFSGYNTDSLLIDNTDGWSAIFHSDRAEDYVAINSTSGFVCDNNDEVDFHTAGSDPVGNIGGECYDIEYDSSKMVVYVDRDANGISSYNVTNPLSLSLLDTIDNRPVSHGLVSGDLIDLYDDLLLSKNNLYSMSLYNVSDPSNIAYILDCNTGGAGQIMSVEIYSEDYGVAGTDDGRFIICNLTNSNYTTNTEWYTLDNFSGESIRAVEMQDNDTIWFMGETLIQPFTINLTNQYGNTPPNISSFTVSDTDVDINQSIDVQIIAGNVEEVDVIRYGVKCEGTESEYTWNTNGIFTCEYSSSGTYNLRVAVTDNYHVGMWYDERVEQISVTETSFTGGILRAVVLDEDQNAIENASVYLSETNETQYTTIYGQVTFSTPEEDSLYELETSKDGYYMSVDNFYSDGSLNAITLVMIPTGDESVLEVTVRDQDLNLVENALVSYTNTLSFEYDWKWSNAIGKAIFVDLDSGSVIVQASKDDYEAASTTAIISPNETTQVTLTLSSISEGSSQTRIDRNCSDNGIWLCGNVDISCEQNSDCLSDFCNPVGRCSRFNYSVCDANGEPRGQSCVYKYTFNSWMSDFTNWLLSNFLWVVIILIVLIAVGIVAFAWRRN